MLRLRCEPLTLRLRHTFTIARGSEDVAQTLILHLESDGVEALGESAPIARFAESVELVSSHLAGLDLRQADPWLIDDVLSSLPRGQRGAMCALDLALHDLAGKRLGAPLYRLLGLNPRDSKQTSFTIGIANVETTVAKTREAGDAPILKIKVGTANDVAVLEAVRSVYSGTIRVDANEGWTPDEAAKRLGELARFDVEFCEQPIPAGQPRQLREIKDRSPIPIFADEDCRTLEDVAKLAGCVDGIVIKLVKCGGIREALRMIAAARALKLKIMLGCMVESSVLATAAAHLTPLVDYADLDGPWLVSDDPFEGIRYDGARLQLPDHPGLGVRPRAAA